MQADDDEMWRAIVDNYGDRVDLEPDPEPPAAPPVESARPASTTASWDDPYPDADWSQDRFVPPPAPPVPRPSQDRMLAWVALIGAPALLVALLMAGIRLPQVLILVLVAAFVGGFLYLIVSMSGEPRDPDDNGARL